MGTRTIPGQGILADIIDDAVDHFAEVGRELIGDLFAGGGGASLGIFQALGIHPDFAVNHDGAALAMHMANHPTTVHYQNKITAIDPLDVTKGRKVGLLWTSPDCTEHSKAKGCKPIRQNIRDLAWVTVHWAQRVRPRIICVENVEEFQQWGPLKNGKRDPERKGETFREWVRALEKEGYKVEWREIRARIHGAPTIRKRLFIIARCDGRPIVWPVATHSKDGEGGLLPFVEAHEFIDWNLPIPSIFNRKRPLKPRTLARIAKGVDRFVLKAAKPFLVTLTHHGGDRVHDLAEPVPTITGANRGEMGLVAPFLVPRYGEREGQEPRTYPINASSPTVVPSANGHQLCAAFLAQHNGGTTGYSLRKPISTFTARGCQQQIVAAHLEVMRNNAKGRDLREPSPVICAEGQHLSLVASFLTSYYKNGVGQPMDAPLRTVTTRDRFGLVTTEVAVDVDGETFFLSDIGMRMLTPRELFSLQGFPPDYIIDPPYQGPKDKKAKPLNKTAQIRCCGNSVCPAVARAIVAANFTPVWAASVAA